MTAFRFACSVLCLAAALSPAAAAPAGKPAAPGRIVVDLSAGKPANTFRPDEAFGGGVDGMGRDDVDLVLTPHNIAAMREGGLRKLTYRLRTELGNEAWHWNEEGTWSDPARAQGYWTSSDDPAKPVLISHGYNLPRRGNTIDQANNLGYSRLDDGDPETFWKTNPYLDSRYTHAPARPQWAIVDLGGEKPVDAARIQWADPYAVDYDVQYWVGSDDYDPAGRWATFPAGAVRGATGGDVTLKLSPQPVKTRFLRLMLRKASGTAPAGSTDVRDGLGYAVREVAFGTLDPAGRLRDVVRHGKSKETQSVMHVSSTDPWHRAVDKDLDLEQAGLDRIFRGGLTSGLPMLTPVPAFYDTPENAAAEIRFLKRRGYKVEQVEIGEEPDGQYGSPEDYAEIYLQVADAVHAVDPAIKLGGPSFQSGFADVWMEREDDRSWTRRFVRFLKDRGRLGDFNFFSFEHYPFDDICGRIDQKLIRQTTLMADLFKRLDDDGVPRDIPWIIAEYGFSAYSGRAMSELPSALLNADIVGQFMTLGGDATYLFGYTPNVPINQHQPCAGYGNMMLWQADENGQAKWKMPAYYGARMMTGEWAQPGDGVHALYPAASNLRDAKGQVLVTAYVAHRPDGRWALMIVNRDKDRAHPVRIDFKGAAGPLGGLTGPLEVFQYSGAQYAWKDAGPQSRPARSLPPEHRTLKGGAALDLPAYSLTIVRGAGPAAPGG
ncbi:MAG: discoidin domain-containing protein [Caulobacteraceae bacterium]|nr:discoidin domain-containing protein [Caulobacteraceae bacterium]